MENPNTLLNKIIPILENLLSVLKEHVESEENVSIVKETEVVNPKPIKINDFEKLKGLLNSDRWPFAVNPVTVVSDDPEKYEIDRFQRAEGIIEICLSKERDISILDFGCGEGHVPYKAVEKGYRKAIGYDFVKSGSLAWDSDEALLTTSWEKIEKNGPYNQVILFDVLDHTENPMEILAKAISVLAPDGKIFARCHPWCSRIGGHMYKQINKAWIHLIFTPEELANLGYTLPEQPQKIMTPLATYQSWFETAGLKIKEYEVDRNTVEKFFSEESVVKNRIMKSFKELGAGKTEWPKFQLEQSWLDYWLIKS